MDLHGVILLVGSSHICVKLSHYQWLHRRHHHHLRRRRRRRRQILRIRIILHRRIFQ
jgi:hypothetical protein